MTDLDPALLSSIMRKVRVEVRLPMRLKVSKWIGGKETDAHIFEIPPDAEPLDVQKSVIALAIKWKGGFEVGTAYQVERLPDELPVVS